MSGLRGRARTLGFGLATVLGLRRLGFFVPYRYAASANPRGYPALEPAFRAADASSTTLLAAIEGYASDLDQIASGSGPARFDQDWFPRLDAAAVYALVRRERPQRIVEIGSGHSTRFLARAIADGGLGTALIAIDPKPRASLAGLPVTWIADTLQAIDGGVFDALAAGDILFVDSSHIAMPGTDLDRLIGDVLPRLKPGTFLHIHDILLPDPYPEDWEWRGYNESLVVAALLVGGGFDIVLSSHWIATRRPDQLRQGVLGRLPLRRGARETSLWLRKL